MDLTERAIIQGGDARHPWELSRAACIGSVFSSLLSGRAATPLRIADVGAGDRFFDLYLQRRLGVRGIRAQITAIDANYGPEERPEAGILLARDLGEVVEHSTDVIFMMDVLEHVADDAQFLALAFSRLKAGGKIIITVPAFQSLFSVHDVFLKHYRRYDAARLRKIVEPTGGRIVACHYFYTSLIVARFLQLKLHLLNERTEHGVSGWKHGRRSILTRLVETILNGDFRVNQLLSQLGIHLPGLSLLMVVEKS